MVRRVAIIELEEAREYIKTLRWVEKKMIKAFENTDDISLRKIINHHGPILDELIDELSYRGRP